MADDSQKVFARPSPQPFTRVTSEDHMLRSDILDTAKGHITKDRAETHGRAENSFEDIAGHWNWYLGGRLKKPITAFDVAQMMVGFKQARAKGNPGHMDNQVDLVGYAAIGGEIACKEREDI